MTDMDGEGPTDKRHAIVVGVGASAASIDTLGPLFSGYQVDDHVALVLVFQHREALDLARVRKTLAAQLDGVEISDAHDGIEVAGGKVYLAEPNKITTLVDGRFSAREADREPGERGTIDSFFVSLAQAQAEKAIGIVLLGTGGDGTLGVAALKDQGGLAICERVGEEERAHLSDSNTPAAIADLLVPADRILTYVASHVRHLLGQSAASDFEETLAASSDALGRIADILRKKTGNDFHGYKQNTFLRRVQRRMQVAQIADVEAYVEFLRTDRDEFHSLFNDLLIGVTQFFRDRKEFEILENVVVPRILEARTDKVRIWILGCATGEEAYSIAIILREQMSKMDVAPQVQIFATDLDGRALASARVGRYRTSIEADVSPERLARWFVREGDTYCVVKELREICIFSQHNVIKDAPFSKLDLISCRNLLIYMNAELQSRIIPIFHFALLPGRFLFLGNSENVTRHPKLFAPVDWRARIFRRLEAGVRLPPEFPLGSVPRASTAGLPSPRAFLADAGLERRAQRVVERYSPAFVITDDQFQILHFSGRTGRYIDPTAGAASLELLNLIHRDLRLELRAALNRALESSETVQVDRVPLGVNGHTLLVDITIEIIQDRPGDPRNLVVIFRDGPVGATGGMSTTLPDTARDEHFERLEGELRTTRERLQATIEELESTNEELKSSNEEYQSLNEELQSANEELETSREELQSINEELTTVNGELAHRVQELTRATSDLKNFLESTQIATVFLDNELRVMNFTPAVSQVFHLIDTDIGRPISHIKARVPIETLFDDVRHVLRTLSSVERELTASDSETRYVARILPYRSIDNFIAGVVITFIDITEITRAEERQRLLLAELQHRVRNTLAVVRSLVARSAEGSASVSDYRVNLEGRLASLSRTQAAVTRDPQAGVDLDDIVSQELDGHRGQDNRSIKISGPAVRFGSKEAEVVALAVHELTTDAAKYGSLSTEDGRLVVRWDIDGSQLVFEWIERGGPGVDGLPVRQGFGIELLEKMLTYELGAKTQLFFEPAGLTARIELPLTARDGVTSGPPSS